MSNVTAMECTKDRIWIRAATGVEWEMTRAQVQAIYATKTGSAAARRQATITDILASMEATLGRSVASAAQASIDLDPTDLNRPMTLTLGD